MKRLLLFLLRCGVVVAVAGWLASQPGTARIVWHDYVIESSAAFLACAVIAVCLIFYGVMRVWRGPEKRRLRHRLQRLQQGQDELTQGLIAIAAGRAADAVRLSAAARRHMGETPATLLLRAQAAQLAQDGKTANALFRKLAARNDGAVFGYRGLIMQARRSGDWDEVERLAAAAERLDGGMPWLDTVRFEAAARRHIWSEAGDRLEKMRASRLLQGEASQRHGAALLVARSMQEAGQGSHAAALASAERAAQQAPQWLPALINLARRLAEGGHRRALRRAVEKGWAVEPHPQLAEALRRASPDPVGGYRQMIDLCRQSASHPASLLALAEAAADAAIWGEARRHAATLLASPQPPRAACRLMARIERGENGDDKAAAHWLAKAADAAPDSAWLCSACGDAQAEWQATCACCGAFSAFDWRRPGIGRNDAAVAAPPLLAWPDA